MKTKHTLAQSLKAIPKNTLFHVVVPGVLLLISVQLLQKTTIGNYIETSLTHPLLFQIKEKIRPSTLHERIKILSFDNRTYSHLKSLDLSLDDWSQTLQAIASKPNVTVLVTKLFDSPYSPEEITRSSQKLTNIPESSRIYPIVFATNLEIPIRSPIEKELLQKNESILISKDSPPLNPPSLDKFKFSYGAQTALLKSFHGFGHAEYTGNHRITPLQQIEPGIKIPHIALSAVAKITEHRKHLTILGHTAPTESDGTLLLNTIPFQLIQKRSLGLVAAVVLARQNRDLTPIKSGDIVVVLPSMFTGAIDFVDTPLGSMPSGFITVSLLNSALQGQWIREWNDPGAYILVLGVMGFLIGFLLSPTRALLGLLSLSMILCIGSMALFCFALTITSFILPILGLSMGGFCGLIVRTNVTGIEQMRQQKELEIANLVQSTFMKESTTPANGPVFTTAKFIAASECGGDWWGEIKTESYSYIMIGDAVGHGVPAALVTAAAYSVVQTHEAQLQQNQEPLDPSIILKSINRVLCSMSSELACMTFMALRVEYKTGETVVANAGNPQPVLIPTEATDNRLSPNQRTKVIAARGDVLGLANESEYQTVNLTMKPGDQLICYTDGLIENECENTGKPLGKNWIKSLIPKTNLSKESQIPELIWQSYRKAVGSTAPNDDVTVVVVEFQP